MSLKKPAAFVCLYENGHGQDKPRVFVVLLKESNKWALPGGYIDAGEKPVTAALRELREEAGFTPDLDDKNMEISQDGNACFFFAKHNFDNIGHNGRVQIFKTRRAYQSPPETIDYGFARLENGTWVVRDYSGNRKGIQTLRGGTIEGLLWANQRADT